MEMAQERIRECLIKLTQSLVDIPTENNPPNGYERDGQNYVKALLEGMGLAVEEFSPLSVPRFSTNAAFLHDRNYEGRDDILGIWKGKGGGKSLLLTGHMDVAPKEPLPWTVCEPYRSVVKNGKIYGRGTSDMKGGLACALTAIRTLRDSGFIPKGDIIFESVVDEEYAGSAGTIASRLLGYNADFGIVLEPTGLMICPACVGGLILKITATGIAGMPYTGEEIDNPAYYLADIINLIREWDRNRTARMVRPTLWEKTPQTPQIVITKAKAGEVGPHGQLSTPADAWIEMVIQTYPGDDVDAVVADFSNFILGKFAKPDRLHIEREYHYCRPAAPHIATPAIGLLSQMAKAHTDKAVVCGAMFSCDLYAFEEYGKMPAVIFGPVGEMLHGPDEYVDI
ncbi:MAG: M20/M25/M40 family metallo-hydrolase, partial [Spirochaetaceae bacterium]|nr:M20/M25/M40 family metallo-hydrolase [Spirochaetaceae bacterium]